MYKTAAFFIVTAMKTSNPIQNCNILTLRLLMSYIYIYKTLVA